MIRSALALCVASLAAALLSACATSENPAAASDFGATFARSGLPKSSEGTFAIDLPTALQLAAGRNLDVAAALAEARRTAARSDQAVLSLLPDLSVGASFAERNGLLQDIVGTPINTRNVNDSIGLGGNGGTPGVALDLSLGKAIFAPLAARQDHRAANAAARASLNQVLADAAAGYFELVRARAQLQIARELDHAAARLADSTAAFAEAGEGLLADAERAKASQLLRQSQTAAAEAQLVRRSVALARTLHLPPTLTLVPSDDRVAQVELVDPDESPARLVATALRNRPETQQLQAEVAAAAHRLNERKISPFLPNLAAGYSNYRFAAGVGGSTDEAGPREDVAAMIYWKLEGLGFGNAAQAREEAARLELRKIREARMIEDIAAEVTAARAEAIAQRARIPLARQAATHARAAYRLTTERLEQAQGLPIEALASIQTLAEARQAEISAIVDSNIAQHRLLAAIGAPSSSIAGSAEKMR